MGATGGTRSYWWDWYDIQGRLLNGYDKKEGGILLVDVGGGKGHDIQIFHERFAVSHTGCLVLQDMPSVIEGIQGDNIDGSIKKMGHDFFEPQPVKGQYTMWLNILVLIVFRRQSLLLASHPP
jgi:hypothetical protein